MRNKALAASHDLDPIETVLFFLLKNWLSLILLPVIAGVVAFVVTQQTPRTFTATLRIPAPPAAIAGFDDLWRGPGTPYTGMVAADGSVLVSHSAATGGQAREAVAAAQVAVAAVATESITAAREIGAKLSEIQNLLLGQAPATSQGVLSAQATALVGVISANEAAAKRSSALAHWSQSLNEQQIVVSSSDGSSRIVPFAAISAFALALALAIARQLIGQVRDRRKTP